ncbi:MAG: MarR family winged helix-turn-helix transcriptional regulator [Desulfococcaceae bacterium]|jgi:DNA-binding MarR family transcriptional regulator|nr:MarR family winged helix-turn-helix transcriptional regulator [Desulfococcaceae bacterium]
MNHHHHSYSDTITDQVLGAIRQIMQAIDLHSRYLVKYHGLTGPQLLILKEIYKRGEVSVSELAKAISLSQSTVTGILIRLEKRELLLRNRSDEDRRRVLVKVTPKCMELLHVSPPPLQDRFLTAFANLESWEQHMILSSLQRLVALMNAGSFRASPILATGPIETASDSPPDLQNDEPSALYPDPVGQEDAEYPVV